MNISALKIAMQLALTFPSIRMTGQDTFSNTGLIKRLYELGYVASIPQKHPKSRGAFLKCEFGFRRFSQKTIADHRTDN